MHNSGALVYALSVGRPVLARRSPYNEAIARGIGEQWLILYDGELTAEILRDALIRTQPSGLPDLSRWDWSTSIALHVACYRVLAAGKGRLPTPVIVGELLEADPAFAAHSTYNAPAQIL